MADQNRSEEQRRRLTEQIEVLTSQCRADAQKLTEDEAALTAFRVGMTELEQNVRSAQQRREHGAGVFNELQMEKMAVGQKLRCWNRRWHRKKIRWDDQQSKWHR